MASLLYGVTPHDPATIAGAGAVLVVVSVIAAAVPAWRATRVDPSSGSARKRDEAVGTC
ncbi:MAG TPA: hypothetical protein VJU87_07970 [Gemmatimonadaceae bacterium]|nr:hypothetical protein [Gemmatimonadaceae bacterium]